MLRERIVLGLAVAAGLVAAFLLGREFGVRTPASQPAPAISLSQGDTIVKELRSIHELLQKRPAAAAVAPSKPTVAAAPAPPQTVEVRVDGLPSMGRADAPVTLVEFTDYQCPFCSRFHDQTFPALKARYIDTGKVRYVVHDLPLSIHPQAPRAAEAAHCAEEQGRYFEMQQELFRRSQNLSEVSIIEAGQAAKLDENALAACLKSGRYPPQVQKAAGEAASLGITGTPTFAVGTVKEGKLTGRRLVGAQPLESFELFLATAPAKN